VDKPLGLQLGERRSKTEEGGVIVQSVQPGGNAAKAGLKSGDTVLYTSSWFGDELWPADKVAFSKTAINAKADSVDFIILRGKAGDDINVKRLKARPSPPRFGRKLTPAQKANATHICLDCGYIYYLPTDFDDQPKDYECPQCAAPKSRFAGCVRLPPEEPMRLRVARECLLFCSNVSLFPLC
jgi:rubredoxin